MSDANDMCILDRLKPHPRWKPVDATVRLEAIRELDDQLELSVLGETDPDTKVRRAVVAKLTDPGVLGRIATTDTDPETVERASDRLVALASQPLPQPLQMTGES